MPILSLLFQISYYFHIFTFPYLASAVYYFYRFTEAEDAAKDLEATNGTTLEKNGQIILAASAKSVHGPGAGAPTI